MKAAPRRQALKNNVQVHTGIMTSQPYRLAQNHHRRRSFFPLRNLAGRLA